jgi:uncharacterized protein (TIGR00251 family)
LIILEVKITVLVSPASKKKSVKKILGLYKFFLRAPPVDGKANQELIDTVAELLGIPKRQVEIVGGHASKTKKLLVSSNFSQEEIEQKLLAASVS